MDSYAIFGIAIGLLTLYAAIGLRVALIVTSGFEQRRTSMPFLLFASLVLLYPVWIAFAAIIRLWERK